LQDHEGFARNGQSDPSRPGTEGGGNLRKQDAKFVDHSATKKRPSGEKVKTRPQIFRCWNSETPLLRMGGKGSQNHRRQARGGGSGSGVCKNKIFSGEPLNPLLRAGKGKTNEGGVSRKKSREVFVGGDKSKKTLFLRKHP